MKGGLTKQQPPFLSAFDPLADGDVHNLLSRVACTSTDKNHHCGWSIQVYKARVRRTGALVAVKVQRPDAFRSAAVDMYLLRYEFVSNVLQSGLKFLRFFSARQR